MSPRVSVIMPSYNYAGFLPEAIESLRGQTYRDFEIIIVDDGSTDNTLEVIKGFPEVRYFRQENKGVSAARNYGLAEAKGELIAFLDSDDICTPDKLAKQVAYLDAHPECEMVFVQCVNFQHGELSDEARMLLNRPIPRTLPAALYRASVFEKVGRFNESLRTGEDSEWQVRANMRGVSFVHMIDEPLYHRRVHGKNNSLTNLHFGSRESMRVFTDAIRKSRMAMKNAEKINFEKDVPVEKARSVSVIIPAWNAEKYLGETLLSVQAQDYPYPIEILVVDDGSTDGTVKLAESFGATVIRKENGGAASARNLGLEQAAGGFIFFLDADDLLTPGTFSTLAEPMFADTTVACVFANAVDFFSSDVPDTERQKIMLRDAPYGGLLPGCALLRRQVVEKVGKFDETLKVGETVAWQMALRQSGFPMKKLDFVSCRRRLHMTNAGRTMANEEYKSYASTMRKNVKK